MGGKQRVASENKSRDSRQRRERQIESGDLSAPFEVAPKASDDEFRPPPPWPVETRWMEFLRPGLVIAFVIGVGFGAYRMFWSTNGKEASTKRAPVLALSANAIPVVSARATASVSPPPPIAAPPPVATVSVAVVAKRGTELVTIADGRALESGDHYAFQVTAAEPVYAAVFQIGKTGKLERLYPQKRDLLLQPGRSTLVPPPEEGVFKTDDTVGTERLVFATTAGPVLAASNSVLTSRLRADAEWPASWSVSTNLVAQSAPRQRGGIVRVRGTSFLPASQERENGVSLVSVTFLEIDHTAAVTGAPPSP
jgi:hypothetical protein